MCVVGRFAVVGAVACIRSIVLVTYVTVILWFKQKLPSFEHFLVLYSHLLSSSTCLNHCNYFGEPFVSHVFQFTEHARFEEYLMKIPLIQHTMKNS